MTSISRPLTVINQPYQPVIENPHPAEQPREEELKEQGEQVPENQASNAEQSDQSAHDDVSRSGRNEQAPIEKASDFQIGKNIVISTKFKMEDFEQVWDYEKDANGKYQHPYYCSFCVSYSNRTLAFACCANYVCLYCAQALAEQAIKTKAPGACPFGCHYDVEGEYVLEINDIDYEAEIRKYTDSQIARSEEEIKKEAEGLELELSSFSRASSMDDDMEGVEEVSGEGGPGRQTVPASFIEGANMSLAQPQTHNSLVGASMLMVLPKAESKKGNNQSAASSSRNEQQFKDVEVALVADRSESLPKQRLSHKEEKKDEQEFSDLKNLQPRPDFPANAQAPKSAFQKSAAKYEVESNNDTVLHSEGENPKDDLNDRASGVKMAEEPPSGRSPLKQEEQLRNLKQSVLEFQKERSKSNLRLKGLEKTIDKRQAEGRMRFEKLLTLNLKRIQIQKVCERDPSLVKGRTTTVREQLKASVLNGGGAKTQPEPLLRSVLQPANIGFEEQKKEEAPSDSDPYQLNSKIVSTKPQRVDLMSRGCEDETSRVHSGSVNMQPKGSSFEFEQDKSSFSIRSGFKPPDQSAQKGKHPEVTSRGEQALPVIDGTYSEIQFKDTHTLESKRSKMFDDFEAGEEGRSPRPDSRLGLPNSQVPTARLNTQVYAYHQTEMTRKGKQESEYEFLGQDIETTHVPHLQNDPHKVVFSKASFKQQRELESAFSGKFEFNKPHPPTTANKNASIVGFENFLSKHMRSPSQYSRFSRGGFQQSAFPEERLPTSYRQGDQLVEQDKGDITVDRTGEQATILPQQDLVLHKEGTVSKFQTGLEQRKPLDIFPSPADSVKIDPLDFDFQMKSIEQVEQQAGFDNLVQMVVQCSGSPNPNPGDGQFEFDFGMDPVVYQQMDFEDKDKSLNESSAKKSFKNQFLRKFPPSGMDLFKSQPGGQPREFSGLSQPNGEAVGQHLFAGFGSPHGMSTASFNQQQLENEEEYVEAVLRGERMPIIDETDDHAQFFSQPVMPRRMEDKLAEFASQVPIESGKAALIRFSVKQSFTKPEEQETERRTFLQARKNKPAAALDVCSQDQTVINQAEEANVRDASVRYSQFQTQMAGQGDPHVLDGVPMTIEIEDDEIEVKDFSTNQARVNLLHIEHGQGPRQLTEAKDEEAKGNSLDIYMAVGEQGSVVKIKDKETQEEVYFKREHSPLGGRRKRSTFRRMQVSLVEEA